jgi:predicted N-acyltransferase
MYGDLAPLDELNELSKKYPSLHFYVDDAHGMSWSGKNGSGCVFEKFKENHKTILVTTMAKGFGSIGGIVVFPDDKSYQRVQMHGGPLAYSHPIAPAIIGASIASAEIHLSEEIYTKQNELKDKIAYCNELLAQTDLPVLSHPKTPIYFIGTGQPNVGYNLNKKILDQGYYVNIGMFPAVSVKNTGLRFTLTNHISKDDIKSFITTLNQQYKKTLKEEGKTINDIRKAFKLPFIEEKTSVEFEATSSLKLTHYNSITEVDKNLWNALFNNKGNFDWEALLTMEKAYSGNQLEEENWTFHYLVIEDIATKKIVLATHFTASIFKDDLLAPAEVSKTIEAKRKDDKYYLCSKTLSMGSLLTEGQHLHIDRNHHQWNEAVILMVNEAFKIQENEKANSLILRDFNSDDMEIASILNNQGFFKMDMPNSNVIHFKEAQNGNEDYIEELTSRSRRGIRYDDLKHSKHFKSEVSSTVSNSDLKTIYELYEQTAQNNYGINIFKYPFSLFQEILRNDNWEFFILRTTDNKIVATLCCYKGSSVYSPVLMGVDYLTQQDCSVYKQIMYRVVVSARIRGFKSIFFGYSADIEKKKLGAEQIAKTAYINVLDQYNLELIDKITL